MIRSIRSLVAGVAFVGVLTVVVRTMGAAVGLFSRPSLIVVAGGVPSAALAGILARPPIDSAPFRLGAVVAGAATLLLDRIRGGSFGALAIAAVVVAAFVALVGPALGRFASNPFPGWVAALGLVLVAFVLVRIVAGGGELGHDEAAYAVKARAWLEGTPDTGWSLHRGIGQSVLALSVLPLDGSAAALRLLSVVLSLGTVVAVWGVGRTMRSNRVGVAAAALFAVAPSFLRRGAEFLSDIPSTGLLLFVTALLWRWLTSERPADRDLYLAVVVAAAAFYIRYQSVLSLALLAVAGLVVGWSRIAERREAVAIAVGLGLGLLVPHFVWATAETGKPWGVITFTAAAGRRAYVGEGLVDYLRDLPDLLAGQLGAVSLVVAVAWFVWRAGGPQGRRAVLYLAIPSLGQFLALGLISHGEPRFVFYPVALMMVAAAMAVDDLYLRIPEWVYRAGVFTLAVALVASLGLHGSRMDANAEARGRSIAVLEEAAQAIAAEADRPCGVITGMQPQMTWLTGCATASFDRSEVRVRLGPEYDRFMLFSENGPREPDEQLEEAYERLASGEPIRIDGEGSIGDVEIWRLRD